MNKYRILVTTGGQVSCRKGVIHLAGPSKSEIYYLHQGGEYGQRLLVNLVHVDENNELDMREGIVFTVIQPGETVVIGQVAYQVVATQETEVLSSGFE